MKLSKKTINIFYITVPIIITILFVFAFKTNNIKLSSISIGIASSLSGAYIILLIEKWFLGNPFNELALKLKTLGDIHQTGLLRVFKNRSKAQDENIIFDVIHYANKLDIYGVVCNFIIREPKYKEEFINKAKNTPIRVVLLSPLSNTFKERKKGENWEDNYLENKSKSVLKELLEIKKNAKHLKIYVQDGECHNMSIISDKHIIVSPYNLYQKGAYNPLFLFSKNENHIIDSYSIKFDKMNLKQINNSEDIEKLFKEV